MHILAKKALIIITLLSILLYSPLLALAATAEFNAEYIISDAELQDYTNWTTSDIQRFLDSKGSYLSTLQTQDANGVIKSAAEIIHDAAAEYQINPKYILVTLQKEQSLITDDSPTQKQLDWAAGYGVCDSCSMDDPRMQKFRGFGKQVDNAAGIMRWYYNNTDRAIVKKKDAQITIDDMNLVPQSWATAFLYTYTPHIHGNKNFWRIWSTWFEQVYPDGTLFKSASSGDYWILQDGKRRHFKNMTALITRSNPKLAISIADIDLSNYPEGSEISFPNFSILKSSTGVYLVDYDRLRPFASADVVQKIGFNPDEIIDVSDVDLANYTMGPVITASSTAPQGVVYEITDAKNTYYLLKEDTLYPITDKAIVDVNYAKLPKEKHKLKDLAAHTLTTIPLTFNDGTLLQASGSSIVYVMESGKRRRIADDETFAGMGYKRTNINTITLSSLLTIPEGEKLFLNSSLLSSKDKFLGDSKTPVSDLYKTTLPTYLVAEFPSGRIISGKDIDSPQSIDSLTQLPVLLETLLDDYNLKATTVYNSKNHTSSLNPITFKNGEKITNKDLFYSGLIGEYGTATRMVALTGGSSESDVLGALSDRFNQWGVDDTTLTDITGTSSGNKSTARDILLIFNQALKNDTMLDALSSPQYTFKEVVNKDAQSKHTAINANDIITLYPISKRGYNILATTASTNNKRTNILMLIESKKTKKQYIIVTLGDASTKPFNEANKIAEWISTGKVKVSGQ